MKMRIPPEINPSLPGTTHCFQTFVDTPLAGRDVGTGKTSQVQGLTSIFYIIMVFFRIISQQHWEPVAFIFLVSVVPEEEKINELLNGILSLNSLIPVIFIRNTQYVVFNNLFLKNKEAVVVGFFSSKVANCEIGFEKH